MESIELKAKNGITLIALVITIIVMLILVAVTISLAINGGLFGYAGNAVRDTEQAKEHEQKIAEGYVEVDGKKYDSLEDYINGYESGVETFSEIYSETKEYKENGITTAWIPKGFAVGTSKGINKAAEGLVIQDDNGNQFVWIPVEYTATGTVDSNGLDSGFLEVFHTNGIPASNNKEEATNDPTGKYNEMMLSVQEHKGFYVGRYEAGIPTTEIPREEQNTTNPRSGDKITNYGLNTMVVKRDCYPYYRVGWGKSGTDYTSDVTYSYVGGTYNFGKSAVYLSLNMYTGDNYGITSTLCYGSQWEAMLNFIEDTAHNVSSSGTWGNYSCNNLTIDRQEARYSEDNGRTWKNISDEIDKKIEKTKSLLLTTGASDKFRAKNIYDVAGNCSEWTMEEYSSDQRWQRGDAYRGADYRANGGFATIVYTGDPKASFRVTLYIQDE